MFSDSNCMHNLFLHTRLHYASRSEFFKMRARMHAGTKLCMQIDAIAKKTGGAELTSAPKWSDTSLVDDESENAFATPFSGLHRHSHRSRININIFSAPFVHSPNSSFVIFTGLCILNIFKI